MQKAVQNTKPIVLKEAPKEVLEQLESLAKEEAPKKKEAKEEAPAEKKAPSVPPPPAAKDKEPKRRKLLNLKAAKGEMQCY